MANDTNRRSYSFDASLQLKDAGLIASTAAAQFAGSDKIIDVGTSVFAGCVVIDASAIEVGSNDELFTVRLEGSNSASFASGIQQLGSIRLGSAGGLGSNYAITTPGRYEMPFINSQNDTTYRYLRLVTVVAGSIATGINYSAFIGIYDGTD